MSEPTPAVPAPQPDRDARIAELRAKRRARLRWLAIRSAIGAGALGLGVIALVYWLLTTVGGRDLLLNQVVARLPPGTTLTWREAEGPASGPLTLRGVRFAHEGIEFAAEEVVVDPAIRPLLGRRLRLDALSMRDASLELPESDEPFELPRWPESLPQIEPPLSLQADDIRIDRFRVTQARAPLIDVRVLRGGLDARAGRLHVERLRADTDRGAFTLHGDYVPSKNYRMDLVATAVLPAPPLRTRPRLGLVARGDAARLDVAVSGLAPARTRAVATLRPGPAPDRPDWALRADSDGFDPALFAGPDATPAETPWRVGVRASGVGGRMTLQGDAAQGELAVRVAPSTIVLEDQVLDVQPLVVEAFDGRATLRGRADFRAPADAPKDAPVDGTMRFAVNARGFRFGEDDATAIVADADFGIAGRLSAWAAIGTGRVARGRERATLRFDGRGDTGRATLRSLRAETPTGTLDGSGDVAWAPRLAWTFDARLAGFDPGYFAPGWDGAIDGTLSTKGGMDDAGRLSADVDAPRLTGRLRGRALDGRGRVALRPGAGGDTDYAGEVALRLGDSRVEARGTVARALDIDARFTPLQLADLLPDASGVVRGTLRLRGSRTAPDIDADLDGDALVYGDYRAEAFSAQGRLPWRGRGGTLRVQASGLDVGIPVASLDVDARGAVEDLALDARAQGDIGTLALSGDARRRGATWSGALDALQLAPAKGASWRLLQPATFRWDGRSGALTRACLASSGGGSLCASGDWPRRGVDVEGSGLPLTLAQPYLPERDDGRPWLLRGEIALDASLRPAGNAWRGTATVTSATGGLKFSERARRELLRYEGLRLEATLDPQRVQGTLAATVNDDGRLDARIATGWDAVAPLDGEIAVRTDEITWLELFSPDIVEPTGVLEGRVQLGGTRAEPRLGGAAQLTGFTTELPALGITLQDGSVRLDAQPDGTARIDGTVRSGDGTLRVDGTLGWQGDVPLVLNVRGENVLVADNRDLRAVASPDVVVRVQPRQPLNVTGTVTVPSARIDLERLDEGVSASEDVVVLDPANPEDTGGNPLELDLTLVLGDAVRLNGFGLDGALAGRLRVRARPGREMMGNGELSVEGEYTAYGQELEITRGRLIWSGGPVGDPILDIRAEREVGEVTAGVDITGRASAPQAQVWSNPATSQSEALSYLALGRSLSTLSGAEGQQLDAASAALTAGGSLLASQIGARIGLDDAGVMQSRALGGSVFGVGKYLSPRLYVGYGVSLVGAGQVLTLKYLLRKGFDLQIESSTVETRGSLNLRRESD